MNHPSHFLKLPEIDHSSEEIDAFEHLYIDQIHGAWGGLIDYRLTTPKWQFLNYLGESKDVVFHGSGASDIGVFEPRKSMDVDEFGDQKAVYAASDAIWATFFAILDRDRHVWSLNNTCIRKPNSLGEVESLYFFSINDDALPHRPWRSGTLYILPRNTFEPQAKDSNNGTAQWRSVRPVKPLAKITVEPADFPFLEQIRGHDAQVLIKRANANPAGFPWLDK